MISIGGSETGASLTLPGGVGGSAVGRVVLAVVVGARPERLLVELDTRRLLVLVEPRGWSSTATFLDPAVVSASKGGGGYAALVGYRTWVAQEIGKVTDVAAGLTLDDGECGSLVSAPDHWSGEDVATAMLVTLESNGIGVISQETTTGGHVTGDAVETFDNASLRAALESSDLRSAAEAMRTTGVLLARVEVGPGDRRVMIATRSDEAKTLIAFTSAETALAWGRPELAVAVVLGADLVEVLAEQGVESVLVDPAGPTPVAVSADQLASLMRGGDV